MPALRSTRGAESRGSRRSTRPATRGGQDGSEEPEVLGLEEGDIDIEDEEIADEEEEDEEEAETRCICKQMDPPDADGLFIQCEKCSVWQHGFCVSIKDIVPEKYWCERCRPELHTLIVRNGEKISKYLPVQPKESKKPGRRGAKSSSASASHDDDQESASSRKQRRERATLNSREDARYEALIQRVMEESKKDAPTDVKSEDEEKPNNGRGSRNRRRKHDEDNDDDVDSQTTQKELLSVTEGLKEPIKEPRVSKLKKDSTENDTSAGESTNQKTKKQKRTKANRSPQKEKDSSIDFNKPTKPRLPQQRTTINEMRRRVAAILEFIGRTQVDIAAEQSDKDELTKYVDDDESKQRIEGLFDNYKGSLEQMDALTRKLLLWENKFGKFGEK